MPGINVDWGKALLEAREESKRRGLRACSVCYGPCIYDDSSPWGRCASSGNTTLVEVQGPVERVGFIDHDGRVWFASELARFLAGEG